MACGVALALGVAAATAQGAVGADAPQDGTGAPPEPQTGSHAEIDRQLSEAAARTPSPADLGGRAWLAEGGDVAAGGRGRWRIAFEVGPQGVAVGGAVFLQVSPFWGWSTPQSHDPAGEGFTRLSTDADGVTLEGRTVDAQLMGAFVSGRALRPGERVEFDYGCGPAQARADTFAEACSRFWIAVDGDGDGVREVQPDSPCVRVLPGRATALVLHVPSVVRPDAGVRAVLACVDGVGNAVREVSGTLELSWDGDASAPRALELDLAAAGRAQVELPAPAPGLHTLRATLRGPGLELSATSNPLDVNVRAPRVLWADLHGHSAHSDGTGTPQDWYDYARAVAGLDVAALTDHDHWGLLPLDAHPALWDELVAAARDASRPGRFLALPGYEWTHWTWGHRHVVFFGDETPLVSSIGVATTTDALARALAGKRALAFPHHPFGGPVPVDWRVPPGPDEVAVEIASAHGSSESKDTPAPIYASVPGCNVREALQRGYRLGLVANGDGHDGHPGLTHLDPGYPCGGVTAILAEEPTAAAVEAALRARRTYATSGPRMILRFALGGARMGEEVPLSAVAQGARVYVRFVGTAAVREVGLVRSGAPGAALGGAGERDLELSGTLEDLRAGEWIYVRVEQVDGHAAWSSPIFVTEG